MLMDIPFEDRIKFLERVTRGAEPAYRITHEGDPEHMERLIRTQPNMYTAHRLTDRLRERLAA